MKQILITFLYAKDPYQAKYYSILRKEKVQA